MYETNLLTQLQTIRYVENRDMWEHLMKMTEIKEHLAEMNHPVSNESFVSYIRTSLSLSLVPNYWTLLTTLSTASHESGKKLTSSNLIWHLNEEANSIALEDSINKSNTTMMAATMKSRGGKGKDKSNKEKCHWTNPNCGKDGHTKDQCFAKGGGKEKEAPEWFKKMSERKVTSASANAAEKTKNDDSENYVMFTYDLPDNPTALLVTSNFTAEAHAISHSSGIILDSGASRHFTPKHLKLLNYREIKPKPIWAADGWTFSALGKGDLKVELPNGDQKLTPITLKNVYYSPHMAFTLMSVSSIDNAGFSLLIKGRTCVVRSLKSNIIGHIPLVRGLYHVGGFNSFPTPVANSASKLMSISELHRKMGHINHDNLRKMVKEGMVKGIELDFSSKPEFCKVCIKAKADRKPFPKKSKTVYTT
jgi:hypothetical protein